eukprot:TRINITY_DN9525_c0_g1_i1.p1 TRINITY_DN9525_c0_g1~~TRINITY_DN9525_c0_g1_i1.p1  ORF type:complete len:340 (-),score=54.30 TRINITY_DN9525_c0_g1_i1:58-1077(-)
MRSTLVGRFSSGPPNVVLGGQKTTERFLRSGNSAKNTGIASPRLPDRPPSIKGEDQFANRRFSYRLGKAQAKQPKEAKIKTTNDLETFEAGGIEFVATLDYTRPLESTSIQGISIFDTTKWLTRTNPWFSLPIGSEVTEGLVLVNDNLPQGHWSILPEKSMPLTNFLEILQKFGSIPPWTLADSLKDLVAPSKVGQIPKDHITDNSVKLMLELVEDRIMEITSVQDTFQDEDFRMELFDELVLLRAILEDYKPVPASYIRYSGILLPLGARPYSTSIQKTIGFQVNPKWRSVLVPLIEDRLKLAANFDIGEEDEYDVGLYYTDLAMLLGRLDEHWASTP